MVKLVDALRLQSSRMLAHVDDIGLWKAKPSKEAATQRPRIRERLESNWAQGKKGRKEEGPDARP